MSMDAGLRRAAKKGDVSFLKKAVSIQPSEYFLTQALKDETGNIGGNIFHLAIWNNQLEFISEAKNILPANIQKQLLFQVDVDYVCTPLHTAAVMSQGNSNYEFVVIIKEMFGSLDVDYEKEGMFKPWLALTPHLMTPLHLSLKDNKENEKCAMEILLMDRDYVSCTMVDSDGNTPLYYALKNGFNLVAETILMSPLSSNSIFSSKVAATPFDCAINCSHCANNCSVIGISVNRTILHNVIAKLVPTANREENPDRMRLLEEGSLDVPLTERNTSSIAE